VENIGFFSLVPTLTVVVLALITKKTFESLLGGTLVGFLMLSGTQFFTDFTKSLLLVMKNDTVTWVILVCGLFGSLIQLLVLSGGARAFAEKMLIYIKNRKQALLLTWILGIAIFIDDYLNALSVGSSMKRITDKFGISREMLAYITDSTAAPVCVLIPISTWAIYVAGLFESIGFAPKNEGMTTYLAVVPYILYGWSALFTVPLVALGIVPLLGKMKTAEARAAAGEPIPPNSENMGLDMPDTTHTNSSLWHFALPMLVLIGATIFFDNDALKGVMLAVVFTLIYFLVSNVMSLETAFTNSFEGFKSMIYALSVIIMSFVLKDVNDSLGLTRLIVEHLSDYVNQALLPAVVFVALSGLTFATGSFWGTYAISLPIIIPLAQSIGADVNLAAGAVISAGAFGSHACFYGDATILSSSAAGCNNMAHVLTQLPYALLAGFFSVILFVVLGFLG